MSAWTSNCVRVRADKKNDERLTSCVYSPVGRTGTFLRKRTGSEPGRRLSAKRIDAKRTLGDGARVRVRQARPYDSPLNSVQSSTHASHTRTRWRTDTEQKVPGANGRCDNMRRGMTERQAPKYRVRRAPHGIYRAYGTYRVYGANTCAVDNAGIINGHSLHWRTRTTE